MTLGLAKRPARTGGVILGLRELRNAVLSEPAAAGLPPITQETQNG